MLYAILKISARLALRIYCGHMLIQDKKILREAGPLLFASNHPNSFLDALIVAANTKRKTYILVRGDVFKNPWAGVCLRYLGGMPIYRGRDGRSMLGQNTLSFEACLRVFDAGDHVLIFSEGNCENEWRLRPLGKGTARLAFMSWQSKTSCRNLRVIPVGFTYSHFNGIGKHVITLTGRPMHAAAFIPHEQKDLIGFNRVLQEELGRLILQFDGDPAQIKACSRLMESSKPTKNTVDPAAFNPLQQQLTALTREKDPPTQKRPLFTLKNILILPFAAAGWLWHAPLYYPVKSLVKSKMKGTVYYDSVLFGALFFLYPLYLILLAALLIVVTKSKWCGLIVIAAPWLAFLTVRSRLFKGVQVNG